MHIQQLIRPRAGGIVGLILIALVTGSPAAAQPGMDEPPAFGFYNIKEFSNSKCLDVLDHGTADGTPVQVWDCANPKQANQTWIVSEIFTGAGLWFIRSQESGKCLNTSPAGNAIPFNIASCPPGGIAWSQLFVIRPVTFLGHFWIHPAADANRSLCMDTEFNGNGARVLQRPCSTAANLLWSFTNVGP